MKKVALVLAVVCMVLSLGTVPVCADVIYEPDDQFYYEHMSSCSNENRVYIANGPGGEVTLYENPESSEVQGKSDNGTELYVSVLYKDKDGNEWAQVEQFDTNIGGWIPLAYLYSKYSDAEFRKDYPVRTESGMLPGEYLGENIFLWDYPGGEVMGDMIMEEDFPEYYQAFTDEEGRVWGYYSYYYGWKNFWVCIDAPAASEEELYPDGKPVRDQRNITAPDVKGAKVIVPKDTVPAGQLAAVSTAVVAVMALSAVLLKRMKKEKK